MICGVVHTLQVYLYYLPDSLQRSLGKLLFKLPQSLCCVFPAGLVSFPQFALKLGLNYKGLKRVTLCHLPTACTASEHEALHFPGACFDI